MNNKKLQAVIWAVVIGCMMIGGFLGVYIIGKETGEYNYEIAISIIGEHSLGFVIFLLFLSGP